MTSAQKVAHKRAQKGGGGFKKYPKFADKQYRFLRTTRGDLLYGSPLCIIS